MAAPAGRATQHETSRIGPQLPGGTALCAQPQASSTARARASTSSSTRAPLPSPPIGSSAFAKYGAAPSPNDGNRTVLALSILLENGALQPHLLTTGRTPMEGNEKTRALFATCRYLHNTRSRDDSVLRLLNVIHGSRRCLVNPVTTSVIKRALEEQATDADEVLAFAKLFAACYRRGKSADILRLNRPELLGKAVSAGLTELSYHSLPVVYSSTARSQNVERLRGLPFIERSRYHTEPRALYYAGLVGPVLLAALLTDFTISMVRRGDFTPGRTAMFCVAGLPITVLLCAMVQNNVDDFRYGRNENCWRLSPQYSRDLMLAADIFQPELRL